MTFVSDPVRTERLLLRPLGIDDAGPIFALFADWEVVRWLSSPPWPYTPDDARAFVEARLRDGTGDMDYRAITVDGTLIGAVSIRFGNATEGPATSPVLGYWLGQPYWGRGYMTEAARGFIGHLFGFGDVHTIYSGAFAGNAASLRVQEKLGFERSGETMLYCRPRGERLPHVNTKLARARFLAGLA